jgi:Ser/Thr protein kinase RdoA (MazF antagonist)
VTSRRPPVNRERRRHARRLAEDAVASFGLAEDRLTFLTDTENTVFRVGGRYVLRIHRPSTKTREEIASELGWLAALRRDTDLAVPDPVASAAGEQVVLVRAEGAPGPCWCVLFRWMDGRFVPGDIDPDRFARVGELTAALHAHAAAWTPPADFQRGRLDAETVGLEVGPDAAFARGLPAADRRAIAAVVARVRADMERVGSGRDAFGVIHADLHQFNVLFHRGAVRAIDFDDCGWGHYLYDVAVALVGAGQSRSTPPLRRAFLAGYRRVRALPADQERLLESFMAARRLILLRGAVGDRMTPDVAAFIGERVRGLASELGGG